MATTSLYPLTFEPVYKEKVWGGSRLRDAFGKDLPQRGPIGESWELVDLPDDESRVAGGALQGTSLHQLVQDHPLELLGPVALDGDRFPLLVKYIDASQTLSVQVHPDPATAIRLGGRPKSEAWYILAAEPDAVLYLGLEPGTTAEELAEALTRGAEVEQLVTKVPVRPGDLFPVPPGTIHAIGAGVLLAEVQQPSDTTYRVYDWGRVGLDGKPRQLHVDEALESTHFGEDPPGPRRRGRVDMELFQIELADLDDEGRDLPGEGPAVMVGLSGEALLGVTGGPQLTCRPGGVVLVPHVLRGKTWLQHAEGRAEGPPRAGAERPMSQAARVMLVTFPGGSG